ncbi:hypothetical protein D9M71_718830 [compost metagenome]
MIAGHAELSRVKANMPPVELRRILIDEISTTPRAMNNELRRESNQWRALEVFNAEKEKPRISGAFRID